MSGIAGPGAANVVSAIGTEGETANVGELSAGFTERGSRTSKREIERDESKQDLATKVATAPLRDSRGTDGGASLCGRVSPRDSLETGGASFLLDLLQKRHVPVEGISMVGPIPAVTADKKAKLQRILDDIGTKTVSYAVSESEMAEHIKILEILHFALIGLIEAKPEEKITASPCARISPINPIKAIDALMRLLTLSYKEDALKYFVANLDISQMEVVSDFESVGNVMRETHFAKGILGIDSTEQLVKAYQALANEHSPEIRKARAPYFTGFLVGNFSKSKTLGYLDAQLFVAR